jgi:hypothetical protein
MVLDDKKSSEPGRSAASDERDHIGEFITDIAPAAALK